MMSGQKEEFLGNGIKKFDMDGKKYAYIISYDSPLTVHQNNLDTSKIYNALRNIGFTIQGNTNGDEENDDEEMEDGSDGHSSDEELYPTEGDLSTTNTQTAECSKCIVRNLDPSDLIEYVKAIAAKKHDASCILLHIIASQVGYELISDKMKPLPLLYLWKIFKGIACPKLFLIQANVTDDAQVATVLFNADNDEDDKYFTLPNSSNMLLAYLPNNRTKNISAAKILDEELHKPYDINIIMTRVIDRLKSADPDSCPKFSSTLLKKLYLHKGESEGTSDKNLVVYNPGKCLIYSFLFGKFDNPKVANLTAMINADGKLLKETFKGTDYEFKSCVKDGYMTLDEFHEELRQIVQDKDKMKSCASIMIVLSSHGNQIGILHASNGCFNLDDVWKPLANCNELVGKPKIVAVDACRGPLYETPAKYSNKLAYNEASFKKQPSNSSSSNPKENYIDMSDLLIVLASIEDMMSFGDSEGSFFIRNLCQMKKKHQRENILTLLTLSMEKVAHMDILLKSPLINKYVKAKQQITFTSILRKIVHLPESKTED